MQRLQRRNLGKQTGERPRQPGQMQGQPETGWMGQDGNQKITDQPIPEGALVCLFDMGASMIDQMHVIHAGGTGGGAGKAGKTAVDMGDDLAVGRATVFQHVLDEVDAAARTVQLVAERDIGGTGGGAEAAMHTFAQDFFGFRHMRIGQLF